MLNFEPNLIWAFQVLKWTNLIHVENKSFSQLDFTHTHTHMWTHIHQGDKQQGQSCDRWPNRESASINVCVTMLVCVCVCEKPKQWPIRLKLTSPCIFWPRLATIDWTGNPMASWETRSGGEGDGRAAEENRLGRCVCAWSACEHISYCMFWYCMHVRGMCIGMCIK